MGYEQHSQQDKLFELLFKRLDEQVAIVENTNSLAEFESAKKKAKDLLREIEKMGGVVLDLDFHLDNLIPPID